MKNKEMNTTSIQWRYVELLEKSSSIEEFESVVNYKFSSSFKKCVSENNGGRPSVGTFDTSKTKEREIKSLFSFNKEDEENIWSMNKWGCDKPNDLFVAFAIDDFGNLICFDVNDDSVIFWNHELDKTEFVAKNFDEFLGMLY